MRSRVTVLATRRTRSDSGLTPHRAHPLATDSAPPSGRGDDLAESRHVVHCGSPGISSIQHYVAAPLGQLLACAVFAPCGETVLFEAGVEHLCGRQHSQRSSLEKPSRLAEASALNAICCSVRSTRFGVPVVPVVVSRR